MSIVRAEQHTSEPTYGADPRAHDGAHQGSSRALQLHSALRGMSLAEQDRALAPVQRRGDGHGSEDIDGAAAAGVRGASAPLPYLDAIQASFGRHGVGHVQAQVGGPAADAGRAIGANAYATGDRVAFAAAPSLHTAAHEAAHVVQQRAGVSLLGGVGRAGDAYERHANQVADLVVQGKSAEGLLDAYAGGGASGAGVQRLAVQRENSCEAVSYTSMEDCHEEAQPLSQEELDSCAEGRETLMEWTENGQVVRVSETEYERLCNSRLRAFEREAVQPILSNAKGVRMDYEHYEQLNDEQRVIGWFAQNVGKAKLPSLVTIFVAEQAATTLDETAKAGKGSAGLRATHRLIATTERLVNKAMRAMHDYQSAILDGASTWTGVMEFTSSVAFSVAGAALTAQLAPGGSVVATGLAASTTAMVANLAKQKAEIYYGLEEDFSVEEFQAVVVREGVSGVAGALMAKATSFMIAEELGLEPAEVEKALRGPLARAFRGVVSDTYIEVTDPQKMSRDMFIRNVATNVTGGTLAALLVSAVGLG